MVIRRGPKAGKRPQGDELSAEELAALPPLARKLRTLLDRKPMSYRHVAAEVGKHGGHLSSAYFGQMINGQSTNVSTAVMDALAKVFNVSPAYFTNDEDVAARQEEKWRRLDELEEHPSADLAKELVDIQLRKATLDGQLAGLDAQSRSEIEEMMAVFFQERDNLRRQN